MSIVCPNTNCRNTNGERTTLPSEVSFCFVCGRAISEKAKEKQNRKENNLRNRKLNDANSEIAILESKLKQTEKSVTELEKIKEENQTLTIQLLGKDVDRTKNEDNIETEKEETKVRWPFIVMVILLLLIVIFVVVFFHV